MDAYGIFNSCGHVIHKRCYNEISRNVDLHSQFMYNNDFERACSLCKFLCNVFIKYEPLVEDKKTKEVTPD